MANFVKCINPSKRCRLGININKIICVLIFDKDCGTPYVVSSIVENWYDGADPPFYKEFDKYEDAEKYFDMLMEELNG